MISKRNILRLFLSLIVIGLILLVLFSVYFLTQRNKTVVLPKPTGPFAMGRIGVDWTDTSRSDSFSTTKGNKRKLSIWIWYPSDLSEKAKKTDYLPGKWETIQEKDSGIPYLQQNFKTIQTNSFQGATLSSKKTSYPLIIFEPGMGDIVFNYTTLVENLASQGYIVVGINPTYSSRFVVFSDGNVTYRTLVGSMPEGNPTDLKLNVIGNKLIKIWTEDISFAVNKLGVMNKDYGRMWAGHLDMGHIGTFGHSFGGAASAEVCTLDSRIKAGIDIDGYLYGVEKSPKKPFMFIMSQLQNDNIGIQEYNKIQGVCNGIGKDGYLLEIPKAAHYSFLDNTLFFSPILKIMGVFGKINGERGLQITNKYITAFFDKYLKNKKDDFLTKKSSENGDVKFQIK